jgi:hypothetical protein
MKRLTLIVLVLSFSAGLALGDENASPSPVLLPPGQSAVRPVHSLHRQPAVNCKSCHPKADGSRWSSQRLSPDMENCAPCHPAARGVTIGTKVVPACRACHTTLAAGERPVRRNTPTPHLRFSHKAHSPTVQCGKCHPAAAAKRIPKHRDMPDMRDCYTCHKQTSGSTQCRACHLATGDGRLITDINGARLIPPAWLKGPTHGTTWVARHAPVAGADSEFCGSCHREAFCQDCHTGRLRPRNVHPGDWMTAHGVSTRLDNPRCRGCHRKQSFCLTCHRRSGVAPDSPIDSRPKGGAGRYHRNMKNRTLMRRAKHDITSCVSCHTESSCITCHATYKPHPAGFRSKCKALATRNPRACAKCHSDRAAERCN